MCSFVVRSFVRSFVRSLARSLVRSFVRSFVRLFVRSFVRPLARSLARSLVRPLFRPVNHSVPLSMGMESAPATTSSCPSRHPPHCGWKQTSLSAINHAVCLLHRRSLRNTPRPHHNTPTCIARRACIRVRLRLCHRLPQRDGLVGVGAAADGGGCAGRDAEPPLHGAGGLAVTGGGGGA